MTWILVIFLGLFLMLCWTRVGIRVWMGNGGLVAVHVKAGIFHIRVFPGKKSEEKADKKPLKAKKPKKEKKANQPMPKIKTADIQDAVRTLWPPLKRALTRLGRGICIQPLDLCLTVGGEDDPASAASLYGYLHAGVWTAMPVLERFMDIPDPHIHIGVDFHAPGTVAEGTAGISIRVGTLLVVGFGVGIPALRWFLRFRKKTETPVDEQAAV